MVTAQQLFNSFAENVIETAKALNEATAKLNEELDSFNGFKDMSLMFDKKKKLIEWQEAVNQYHRFLIWAKANNYKPDTVIN